MNALPLEHYFASEKVSGYLLGLLGLIALALCIALYKAAPALADYAQFIRGASISSAPFALIMLVVGAVIALRTDRQVQALQTLRRSNPSLLLEQEHTRMTKVVRGFRWYLRIEIAALLAGLALLFGPHSGALQQGAGLGLLLLPAALLLIDGYLLRNAKRYQHWLTHQ
ncbi:hypothetical protein [Atopomonas sediminilitoris]|uniref:hypothetical protein n=1 Tax=Atopomonas sediminilitoris TaxID=2919919 RepID=UPI001F4D695A|nr:hypothetical protein [Atopomonas sediminilitoris]MCJ8167863.1 hypothetical protein [Atopomonas sediminilitoris]